MTQDRFKFRAWHKERKAMYPVLELIDNGNVGVSIQDSGPFLLRKNEIVLMQCTGLKDKYGVLIFEGDIVNFEGRLIVIKWNVENKEYFDGERSSKTYVGFSLGLYGLYENSFSKSEIIGNIYENPELLNKK